MLAGNLIFLVSKYFAIYNHSSKDAQVVSAVKRARLMKMLTLRCCGKNVCIYGLGSIVTWDTLFRSNTIQGHRILASFSTLSINAESCQGVGEREETRHYIHNIPVCCFHLPPHLVGVVVYSKHMNCCTTLHCIAMDKSHASVKQHKHTHIQRSVQTMQQYCKNTRGWLLVPHLTLSRVPLAFISTLQHQQ